MGTSLNIRPSAIAGRWYPADPHKLASSVDAFINAAILPEIQGEIIGVMVPHAGHVYSGPVAGYAFAALRGLQPDLVVILSPMHYAYPQPLLTTSHDAYGTPLGSIPVDHGVLKEVDAKLRGRLGFGLSALEDDPEHSLEIELPFLQRVFQKEFCLVPIMVREQNARIASALGKALGEALSGKKVLLVASTDLSHFFPQEIARDLDAEILRLVEEFNPQGVLDADDQGKGFACGKGALAAILWAAKELGADGVKVVRYATSGDVTGDYRQVVGYGAAIMTRQAQ